MGSTFPRRGDYSYVKERVEFTFYSPKTADKLLIDEVYDIVNDSHKAIRIIKVARAAQRLNMRADIQKINLPTCLIWGLNDTITPTYVAHEFRRLIPASRLHFIDRCGHAPMMEQPQRFNFLLQRFLNAYYEPVNVS
jgi:pimeloyl-ACP methyl ester carboxylesterase